MKRTMRLAGALAALVSLACPNAARAQNTSLVTDAAAQLGQAFAAVADRALPSVVAIVVEIVQRNEMLVPLPGFAGAVPAERRRVGGGSGVIIRADGAILTNNHVVEGATRIRVRLNDGRVFAGRVLGVDPASDLAVVKIDAQNLPAARMADSDAARVGEWVLAMGAPFGLDATVTHGVLSARNRGDFGINQVEDYLQTDASINPGNSGGPLVNLRGEVLGINTMIVQRGSGVGFAVPSRIAQFVARQVLATGRVTRGWIGITAQDITPDLERAFGRAGSGALVCRLAPEGPAARAGVRLGDVIVGVDGRPVRGRHEVQRETAVRAVGERMTLTVLRGSTRTDLAMVNALRPGDAAPAGPPAAAPAPEPGPTGFGMTIDAVPAVEAQALGLAPREGVVILEVRRGGAADRAGLQPGDVILRVDGAAVRAPEDVVAAARDGHAVMLVRRGHAQEFVGVHVGP